MRRLSKEDEARIVEAYEKYRGNVSAATRGLPYSRDSIKERWEAAGLQLMSKGGGYTEADISVMVEAYRDHEGNAFKASEALAASKDFPFSPSPATILKYCRDEGLPIKPSGPRVSGKDTSNMLEAYKTYNGNLTLAAARTKYSRYSLRKAWEANGLEIAKPGRKKKTLESMVA